eukprot:scaffold1511_cov170-Amphora_coffeaeformis.AAC.21
MMNFSLLLLLLSAIPGVLAFSATVPFYAVRQEAVQPKQVEKKKNIVPATPASFFAQTLESTTATVEIGDKKEDEEPIDLSVPYNAAAELAYHAAGEPGNEFAAFATRYHTAMVERVKSKVRARASAADDLRVPYNAAAALAFADSVETTTQEDFAAFEARYNTATIEWVKAKARARRAVDVSIPYNAAARLAYKKYQQNLKGTHNTQPNKNDAAAFAAFETKYIEQTIAMVQRKAQRKMAPRGEPVVVQVIEGAATSHEDDLAKVRHLVGCKQDLDLTLGVIGERLYNW